MAGADFRKGRDEALAVTTILAAFAKAERTSLLGFPLREPATLPADAQADQVLHSIDLRQVRIVGFGDCIPPLGWTYCNIH